MANMVNIRGTIGLPDIMGTYDEHIIWSCVAEKQIRSGLEHVQYKIPINLLRSHLHLQFDSYLRY